MNSDIQTGDIVLVKDYPNPQHMKAGTPATKDRFAVVIGNFKEGFSATPAQAIATKSGRTERPGYRTFANEIRLPKGITNSRRDFELKGVILAHRFPMIDQKQMVYKAGRLPLETRLNMIEVHEHIKDMPFYNEMKQENKNYAKFMGFFKDVTIAEKLQFMRDEQGNHHYEFMRDKNFFIDGVQFLEKKKNLNILSVKLKGEGKTFISTVATKKSIHEIKKDWKHPRKSKEWIKEDVKYRALWRNPMLEIRPDKQPHPDKYKPLEKLMTKQNHMKLER